MDKSSLNDYTANIEKGHSHMMEACDEFFDKTEKDEIDICKSAKVLIQIDSTAIESHVDMVLEQVESGHWDFGYHLLSIVMGFVGNHGMGGGGTISKKNCNIVLDCNGLPTIILAFKHHAFHLLELQVKAPFDAAQFEKESKEREKWFCLYANILYIMLTVLSWNPSEDVLEELQYDLFERNVRDRVKYNKKEDSDHFFIVLMRLLKKSLSNEVTDRYNVHSLKKLTMLMHKTLHILFLCDVENPTRKSYSKLGMVLQKERSKSLKLKVLTESKSAYLKENQASFSKPVEEAINVYNKAREKKDKDVNLELPRAMIDNPTTTEVLYVSFSRLCLLQFVTEVNVG